MAEFSMFWTTGTTGDGANPYTMAQVTAWLRRTLTPGQAGGGVLKGHGNELAVTGSSSPVTVGTGGAVVYGYPYENDAAASVAIPTPSGVTRIDRIVLRASWAAQTVRITRVAGTEGGGAPALTQNPGTTYDIPLAQVSITPGGAITITDERVFCVFGTSVPTANIVDGAITAAKLATGAVTTAALAAGVLSADPAGRAKMAERYIQTKHIGLEQVTPAEIANRTRKFLVPAMWPRNETDGLVLVWGGADDPGFVLPDGKKSGCYGSFLVPADFVSGLDIYAVVYPLATGNLYCENVARSATAGETMPQHAHSTTYQAVAVTKDTVQEVQQMAAGGDLDQIAAGEYVALRWTRDATNAADTVNAAARFLGWLVTYEADS